jgi:hypothetical protein
MFFDIANKNNTVIFFIRIGGMPQKIRLQRGMGDYYRF